MIKTMIACYNNNYCTSVKLWTWRLNRAIERQKDGHALLTARNLNLLLPHDANRSSVQSTRPQEAAAAAAAARVLLTSYAAVPYCHCCSQSQHLRSCWQQTDMLKRCGMRSQKQHPQMHSDLLNALPLNYCCLLRMLYRC